MREGSSCKTPSTLTDPIRFFLYLLLAIPGRTWCFYAQILAYLILISASTHSQPILNSLPYVQLAALYGVLRCLHAQCAAFAGQYSMHIRMIKKNAYQNWSWQMMISGYWFKSALFLLSHITPWQAPNVQRLLYKMEAPVTRNEP